MTPRMQWQHVAPAALRAMFALQQYVNRSGLDPKVLELVKLRTSYLNGCAFCVDMHTKDARVHGESEQRLYAVPVWRETPYFTERERAALAWAEAVTEIGRSGVPDDVYEEVRCQFTEAEVVDLTMAVTATTAWNRLAVTFRTEPGTYEVRGSASRIPEPVETDAGAERLAGKRDHPEAAHGLD